MVNPLYSFESKVNPNKWDTKLNDPEVNAQIRTLWDQGLSKGKISTQLKISKTHLTRFTENWEKVFVDDRAIDVFAAHCLLTEHGLIKAEVARCLGIHHSSLCRALKREEQNIKDNYETWKKEHTKWRNSLRVQTLNV